MDKSKKYFKVQLYEKSFCLSLDYPIKANFSVLISNFSAYCLPLSLNIEKTRIKGHFKIGYKVSNMDAWLVHLAALKIKIDGIHIDSHSKKRNLLIYEPDGNLLQFFE